MKFLSGLDPNEGGNAYKLDKLLLQKIDDISGSKFDTFTMGSSESDYD